MQLLEDCLYAYGKEFLQEPLFSKTKVAYKSAGYRISYVHDCLMQLQIRHVCSTQLKIMSRNRRNSGVVRHQIEGNNHGSIMIRETPKRSRSITAENQIRGKQTTLSPGPGSIIRKDKKKNSDQGNKDEDTSWTGV